MTRFKLVLFLDGKRVEKPVTDPAKGIAAYRQLQERGVKCKFVGRTDNSLYPPPRTVKEMRAHGKLWCPYCRDWTWFKYPRWVPNAEVGSVDWMRNAQLEQNIKTCAWCQISEQDWYVKKANDLWGGPMKIRRRTRK